MGQGTNKGLNSDKLQIKREWDYRIIDASYRIHTRLYKLHYAIVHTERTLFFLLRNNMITSSSIVITAIFGIIVLYLQIANITLSPEFYITLIIVVLVILSIYGYQFYQVKKMEKELFKISTEIKAESLETWPNYLFDEAAKWSTRILMAKEILDGNEKSHSSRSEESYVTTKKNFSIQIEYSTNMIKEIRSKCEMCLAEKPENKSYDKTIQICNEFIGIGERENDKWT